MFEFSTYTYALLSFVEILCLEEIEAGPYNMIKSLVHNFTAGRDLQGEGDVNNSTRGREIKNYVCSVFVHYWFLKDLDQVLDPRFGVYEAVARADVAEAQSFRALKLIEAFFKEENFGGLDSAK
jgi:hypothetical protein